MIDTSLERLIQSNPPVADHLDHECRLVLIGDTLVFKDPKGEYFSLRLAYTDLEAPDAGQLVEGTHWQCGLPTLFSLFASRMLNPNDEKHIPFIQWAITILTVASENTLPPLVVGLPTQEIEQVSQGNPAATIKLISTLLDAGVDFTKIGGIILTSSDDAIPPRGGRSRRTDD